MRTRYAPALLTPFRYACVMSWVEIYRSTLRRDCEQRAFLLFALGIASEILPGEEAFALLVAPELAGAAIAHLAEYDAEARKVHPPPPSPTRLHAHAWSGCVAYALILVVAAYCTGQQVFDQDWQSLGALRGTLVRTGEWWRPITALLLHADLGHLFANLSFGVFFGYFAGQMLGAGLAWCGTLLAATLGNLIDSAVMPLEQVSLGASTAVFAMLGLLTAYSWRKHANPRAKWATRSAPLVAGIALLGFTGSGGENTDVVAHLSGFAAGIAVGIAYAWSALPERVGWRTQLMAGSGAVLVIIAAWCMALAR